MTRAGYEPEIPMFERPKTVLALDGAAVETGLYLFLNLLKIRCRSVSINITLTFVVMIVLQEME
jgi:hypothetical protein